MASPPQPGHKYTIAIIGAGIAGPVFALTILSHPVLSTLYTPILYEKLPEPKASDGSSVAAYAAGAAVALTSNALYPLYQLGGEGGPSLREEVDRISAECSGIKIWRAWGSGQHARWNEIVNPGWKHDLGTNLRVVERRMLQGVLLERIKELGGKVEWGKRFAGVVEAGGEDGDRGVTVKFEDGTDVICDLLIGADGSWSAVRKHIILSRSEETPGKEVATERWKPSFSHADGIYGVSKKVVGEGCEEGKAGDTHWILLDHGSASTWALPDGKQFWTIALAASSPPERSFSSSSSSAAKEDALEMYSAEISTGGYSASSTKEILLSHKNIWHPVAGTFGELFKNSERIVRSSLWHKVWEAGDIGVANCVVIGDASRVMVPSSGQGACFGIEDATILANCLLNYPPVVGENGQPSFMEAVRIYAEERAPRNQRMANQSYWTGLLTLGDRWWWRWIRDLGSRWIPMGGDPREKKEGEAKDPMGWLYDVRYQIEEKAEKKEDGRALTSPPLPQ